MKVKELFDRNKNRVIIQYHKGIKHKFNNYEEYEQYLNDCFGDKVVNSVLTEDLEDRASDVYTLEFDLKDNEGRIFNYESFMWVVQ